MKTQTEVVFDKCPLCRRAQITRNRRRLNIPFSKSNLNPCPYCSAEFVAESDDAYRLAFCEPNKLLEKHRCNERIFRGCYLDLRLSKSEWQEISEGREPHDFTTFLSLSATYREGKLPVYPSSHLPFSLDDDETVHYISSPVYSNEKEWSADNMADKGILFLTSKRLVFLSSSRQLAIPLGIIDRVEDCPPGFTIKEKGFFIPHVFFPPKFDPVLAAVYGAIYNFKGKS